jgi:hypothetical protein
MFTLLYKERAYQVFPCFLSFARLADAGGVSRWQDCAKVADSGAGRRPFGRAAAPLASA